MRGLNSRSGCAIPIKFHRLTRPGQCVLPFGPKPDQPAIGRHHSCDSASDSRTVFHRREKRGEPIRDDALFIACAKPFDQLHYLVICRHLPGRPDILVAADRQALRPGQREQRLARSVRADADNPACPRPAPQDPLPDVARLRRRPRPTCARRRRDTKQPPGPSVRSLAARGTARNAGWDDDKPPRPKAARLAQWTPTSN